MSGAFRSVTKRQNELEYQKSHVNIADHYVEYRGDLVAKRPAMIIRFWLRRADQRHDDSRGEVERGERGPSEDNVRNVVEELYVK